MLLEYPPTIYDRKCTLFTFTIAIIKAIIVLYAVWLVLLSGIHELTTKLWYGFNAAFYLVCMQDSHSSINVPFKQDLFLFLCRDASEIVFLTPTVSSVMPQLGLNEILSCLLFLKRMQNVNVFFHVTNQCRLCISNHIRSILICNILKIIIFLNVSKMEFVTK